jgi:hypothetical protein
MGELVARNTVKNDRDRDESDSALDVAVMFVSCPALGIFPQLCGDR